MIRPLLLIGTRPEAIKMAPVAHACERRTDVRATVCLTGQHRELVAPMVAHFALPVHLDLELMQPDQTLAGLTARGLERLDAVLARGEHDCVVAQGDTTTVLCAALAAFYRRVPFVHVEAGLRSGSLASPWPEELNRRVASVAARLHCAPTARARDALLAEGHAPETVHLTGNTVIDALLWTRERVRHAGDAGRPLPELEGRRVVVVTCHRRENHGAPLEAVCRAVLELAAAHPQVVFACPVHRNPRVSEPMRRLLSGRENVLVVDPLSYPDFVWLMDRATLLLSDSGGVQEEAPSLGKPVLVLRETTERPEVIELGLAELVGTSTERIVARATALLAQGEPAARFAGRENPYGDGRAGARIAELIAAQRWSERP